MTEPITTDELLDDAERRTGLLRSQVLMMVAKSAAIRHVATQPERGKVFVLKGGTLLTNVYLSPRQSVGDADYLHLDREAVTADDLEDALQFKSGDFEMSPSFRYDGQSDSFIGDGLFEFESFSIKSRKERNLKITVSVRKGERLDPPKDTLIYHDPMLAGNSRFQIEGLTINELSAEKILAWASKDLGKHLVDLAYVAREWSQKVDHDRVAELVRDKFKIESRSKRYLLNGIRRPADIPRRFTDDGRVQRLLMTRWNDLCQDELFFLPAEQNRADDEQLTQAENVRRLAMEFWAPTLDKMAGGR